MAYVLWRVFMKKYSKVRLGIRNLPVIPVERRVPEKEETWTLAPDQQDPCTFFEDVAKSKAPQDVESTRIPADGVPESIEQPESGTLPRSQETRKSKTKKVRSYLRKCKGALSKGDESSSEKKRQEQCASWYLDESQTSKRQEDTDVLLEKQEEFVDERIAEVDLAPLVSQEIDDNEIAREDPLADPAKSNAQDETPDEALARLLDEDRRNDLRRSRTSLYEDASDSVNDQCQVDESSKVGNDVVSLETLTTEDSNLNKCDSSDTLIAEAAESTPASVPECSVVGEEVVAEQRKEEEEDGIQQADGETLQALSLLGVSKSLLNVDYSDDS
ncbi:uncharacterized protein LOC122395269 [Colletes gigas]|uniref:uncharacterized protein LOC122395269 n=1 Tax=Colletes gigas TaxID=935657 RepID=UPI001C9B75C1|nr:uncharacterized protein LOC122395269 [Colletes gigas]